MVKGEMTEATTPSPTGYNLYKNFNADVISTIFVILILLFLFTLDYSIGYKEEDSRCQQYIPKPSQPVGAKKSVPTFLQNATPNAPKKLLTNDIEINEIPTKIGLSVVRHQKTLRLILREPRTLRFVRSQVAM